MMTDKEKLVKIVCEAMEDGCIGHCNHPPCFRVESVVNALLENGVTVQEWISVKDRLPDCENQRVLAVCIGDYQIGNPRIDTDRYTRGHWVRYGNDVTHWMPIPQPPKGE